MVSCYMHTPGKGHCYDVTWILRYIWVAIDVSLDFVKDVNNNQSCVGYVDSDNVCDLDKCCFYYWYVFTLVGGPVSWRPILKSNLYLYITKVEYMAMI